MADLLDRQIAFGQQLLGTLSVPPDALKGKSLSQMACALGLDEKALVAAWSASVASGATRGFGTCLDFALGLKIYLATASLASNQEQST